MTEHATCITYRNVIQSGFAKQNFIMTVLSLSIYRTSLRRKRKRRSIRNTAKRKRGRLPALSWIKGLVSVASCTTGSWNSEWELRLSSCWTVGKNPLDICLSDS